MHQLFVRLADGTSGRVRLAPETLTGVLALLRERRFFDRVFVDQGAVAIDAPSFPAEFSPKTRYQSSQ
jgi:hypothetical protein